MMSLTDRLREIFLKNSQYLPEYAWASEADRWAELVYCFLQQSAKRNPASTRQAVDILHALGLVHVRVLARLSGEDATTFSHVLKRHGFSDAEAKQAIATLKAIAAVVEKNFEGKIQRFLRRHGERMRDELAAAFRGSGLKEPQISYAVSQWLQNTLSLPVSLEHEAVKSFCKANDVSVPKLLEAADALELNVALLDDLLEMNSLQSGQRS